MIAEPGGGEDMKVSKTEPVQGKITEVPPVQVSQMIWKGA